MISKIKIGVGILVFMALISAFFFPEIFKHSADDKKIITENKKSIHKEKPTSVSMPEAPTAALPENSTPIVRTIKRPAKSIPNCSIVKTEPTVIFSPVQGKISYFVKKDGIVEQGSIVARITRILPKTRIDSGFEVNYVTIDTFKEEIESHESSIGIAHEDIGNIHIEQDESNNNFLTARDDYYSALNDFENGLISEKKLAESNEIFEQTKINLDNHEAMLEWKYQHITENENRVSELKTMISDFELSQKPPFEVISEYKGRVDEMFFNDNEDIGKNLPLMTVIATNVISIDYFGKIPFAANGKKASLYIKGEKFQADGVLNYFEYKKNSSDNTDITSVCLIFPADITIKDNYIGKKAVLFFKAD